MLRIVHLTFLYFFCIFIVSGVKVRLKNTNTISKIQTGATFWFSSKRQIKFFNQKEKKISSNQIVADYIDPEAHISSSITDYQKSDLKPLEFHSQKPKLHSGSIFSSSKNDQIGRSRILRTDDFLNIFDDNKFDVEMDNDFKKDYFSFSKRKRDVRALFRHRYRSSRAKKMENTDNQDVGMEGKIFLKEIGSKVTDNSLEKITPMVEKQIKNLSLKSIFNSNVSDNVDVFDNPWPLVPGPISCDLDFQLRPSFVAKLGEFDYVVSIQLQQNPEKSADHICTGVIYNPHFIIIAPHCLIDNYGLTVTSTDDLCTIDEMIEVDYIIKHKNYDSETRKNDIALIKLKSEIHKKAAVFPKINGTLDDIFYAIGFGELMWKSFPDRISKLLQKVPVRRYSRMLKEAPGTLHITTSQMDLTGVFRGDFGGALVNHRGEFIGLKSKLLNKSKEYEVYTKVQTYLPWIKSMVALHGSW